MPVLNAWQSGKDQELTKYGMFWNVYPSVSFHAVHVHLAVMSTWWNKKNHELAEGMSCWKCTGFLKKMRLYKIELLSRGKKVTIHQVTTMLATSKNVQFPGHNHFC